MTRKLTEYPTLPDFVPGRGYSREDWDAVSDTPELTDEQIGNMRPFREVWAELVAEDKVRAEKSRRKSTR